MREITQEKIADVILYVLTPFKKPIRNHYINKNKNEFRNIKKEKSELENEILVSLNELIKKRLDFGTSINNLFDFCSNHNNNLSKENEKRLVELTWKVYYNNPNGSEYKFKKYIDAYEEIISKMYGLVSKRRLYLGAKYKDQKENFNYNTYRNRVVNRNIDNLFTELFEDTYTHKKTISGIRNDR